MVLSSAAEPERIIEPSRADGSIVPSDAPPARGGFDIVERDTHQFRVGASEWGGTSRTGHARSRRRDTRLFQVWYTDRRYPSGCRLLRGAHAPGREMYKLLTGKWRGGRKRPRHRGGDALSRSSSEAVAHQSLHPCSFRIGSSAKRAFGGCLGSKRR
jgi:hypothetical protein